MVGRVHELERRLLLLAITFVLRLLVDFRVNGWLVKV